MFRRVGKLFIYLSLLFPMVVGAYERVDIIIKGVDGELKKNINAFLPNEIIQGSPSPVEVDRFIRLAPERIEEALRALGFYSPLIDIAENVDGDNLYLILDIYPGLPIIIQDINVTITGEGAYQTKFNNYLKQIPLKQGDVLNHGKYEEIKDKLLTMTSEYGYIDANFTTSELRVSLDQQRAWVDLTLETGSRYYFGKTRFSQNVLDADVMQKFIRFKPGDPYDVNELLKLQNALTVSGYFGNIRIVQELDKLNGYRIPIMIHVSPKKRFKYSIGLGYSTNDSIRGSLGVDNRRVNSRGHRYHAQVRGHEHFIGGSLGYSLPFGNPATDRLSFTTYYEEESETEVDDISVEETLELETRYTHENRWEWTEDLFLQISKTRQILSSDDTENISTLVVPGVSWARKEADNFIFTTNGYRWKTSFVGTDELLGTSDDITFGQIELNGKRILPYKKHMRIIMRSRFGITVMDDKLIEDLPLAYQYFAGGDNSVRGFSFRKIKPIRSANSSAKDRGGRHLFTASIEIDTRLRSPNWRAAAFYDFGNAVDKFKEFTAMRNSVGVGIRWLSPIGPLRLDVGKPIYDSVSDIAIHFTLGPDI